MIIADQTLQGSPTDRIISSQQLYGLPNNQNYQQQSQANSLQKPRGNQQAHNSRELNMNEHYNSNNNLYDNNNVFDGNNMKHEKNKILQQHSVQVGNMLKHHNSYQEIDFNNENTRNSAILNTNVEMNAKSTDVVTMFRPAVRVDTMHTPITTSITSTYVTQPQNHLLNPQNIKPNNYLLTKFIANPVPTIIKAPSSSEYNRSQFRRNIPDNPFLKEHMSQNEFMQNPFLANLQNNRNSQSYLNNQSTQNIVAPKPTPQNPYMSNPFLQNTKMPNLSGQSQPTQLPATNLMGPQSQTSSQNTANLMNVQKPVIISSTPPSTTYPNSKGTKMDAELNRLIQNKAVIFPDSIYLTQSTPSSQHILDIRR
ncbi:putative uncharacterized protein DDB_G0282133 [Bactrocera neohumeralis]|uniref:putative uncharacterized protein DDB_G0282133 n=1 Tax=Bactrocera neohumeralis TaxID=98809 RepID=UPI002165B4F3|nr:putative uncharacterized protein DDB_G0282133 [Bactrocera neohumeralis]